MSLTDRQQRTVDAIAEAMVKAHGKKSPEFWTGMLEGYRAARKAMHADFETFWTTDPKAAQLTYEGLAIEKLSRG